MDIYIYIYIYNTVQQLVKVTSYNLPENCLVILLLLGSTKYLNFYNRLLLLNNLANVSVA